MHSILTQFIEQFGYLSIFLLITMENIFPPIPSEVILTFAGFMTTYTNLTLLGVVLFATIGSVLGAIILYRIGTFLDIERLEKLIERFGHILGLKKQDIYRADSWFKKYGCRTVFFCRMIPLVRSLISIPAGMCKMRFGLFLIYTTIGTLIWNILLVWLGALLGESWEKVGSFMDVYANIAYLALFLIALSFIYFRFIKKKNA